VYERALEIEHRNNTLWLKLIEMEMRHKNVNRARNVFDRVVMILPRVDVFWYKYTYMEELLGNVSILGLILGIWSSTSV
jgi:crooked neck